MTDAIVSKHCIVTGASGGIGKEIARGLAAAGHDVTLVGRDRARTQAAADDVRATTGREVHVVLADLARMADVRRAASELLVSLPKIDALIHNAAVVPSTRNVTSEGIEEAFATNVLAPFLLTELLMPSLERAAPSRVVAFYGGGQPNFDIDDLESARGTYDGWNAYTQTKNACVVLTRAWGRRLAPKKVFANAVLPGIVNTAGMRALPGRMQVFSVLFRPFMRTPAQGARTPIWVATSPDLEGVSGKVFGSVMGDWKKEVTRFPPSVLDDAVAAKLYATCEELAARSA
jgi:retinol dehydrogenase-14